MSTIEDLNYTSISDMSTDEGIELIRQIRLSRRIPVSKQKSTTKSKATAARKKVAKALTPDLAKELLDMIGEQQP